MSFDPLDADNLVAQQRRWTNLFEMLRHRAQSAPGKSIYVRDGGQGQEFRTLSQLLTAAHRVAAALQRRGVEPGDPVLLALPTSFDFVVAFFGLQAAGAIPIPLGWSEEETGGGLNARARWRRRADHYGAKMLICSDPERLVDEGWGALWPIYPVEIVTDLAGLVEGTPPRTETTPWASKNTDVAYIQSTSGTTGRPRGAKLTHQGIAASVEAIGRHIRVEPDDVLVSWLPPDNIMGLVGAICFSLHWGIRLVLLHPDGFLERPEDWLWAISEHRATLSLAPNSAFNYCVRRCNAGRLEGLDLSSWRVAMNGSEPVRAQHLQAFARRFHPYGLGDHILMPVYGLSEATLAVTAHPPSTPLAIDGINRRVLEEQGQAQPLPPQGPAHSAERMHIVSVGHPLPGVELRILNDSGEPLEDRQLGEVCLRGPTVMAGYVHGDDDGRAQPPRWLRTGDLGYLVEEKLYLVGRVEDRIMMPSGRSIFPEEVEFFVDAVDGVRTGSTAAFQDPDGDQVVVAFEVQPGADGAALVTMIRRLLAEHLALDEVRLIDLRPRSIPKTPTGKVRRFACARLMAEGRLGSRQAAWRALPQKVQRDLRDIAEVLRGGAQYWRVRLGTDGDQEK